MANDENIALNAITTKQEHKLYSELFVDSLIQALLIDAPVYGLLGVNPLLGFVGATVGYSLRKYCGEYVGQDNPYKPFVCGALGGIFKYSIVGQTYALEKLALGAYNNIAYEYCGSGIDNLSKLGQLLAYVGIEGGEGYLETTIDIVDNKAFDAKNPNEMDTIVGGGKAGLLVYLSIEGLYEPFAPNIKNALMPYAATAEHFVLDYFSSTQLVTDTISDKSEL